MLTTVNGIPAHILLVHAVVVLVPLGAFLAVLGVAWPALRRRLGVLIPLATLIAVALIPATTEAGEWLDEHLVDYNELVARHVNLGEGLLPWAGLLFVSATVMWLLDRPQLPAFATARWVRPVAGALVVIFAVVSVVQVVRIGDSGSKAAWHERTSASAND